MANFEYLLKECKANSELAVAVIDEFLIAYAAAREGLDRKTDKLFAAYGHIVKKDTEWFNLLKAQFIAHRIFKKGGSGRKLANSSEVKHYLNSKELEFLAHQIANPWRFCFSVIIGNPAEDFFYMADVFTGERILLYSPGVTRIVKDQSISLWFNLIQFNGECWQSFGPILGYKSFDADDIFFFATELHPDIETDEDLLADVERNPIPYMMLLFGSQKPMLFHKQDEVIYLTAVHSLLDFNSEGLKKNFRMKYVPGVYRLELQDWEDHPHFATAFYDEKEQELLLSASTERSFQALVSELNSSGYSLPADPDIRVRPSMWSTVKDILRKEISLNPYEKLFIEKSSPEKEEGLKKINRFLQSVIPELNAGGQPDIKALAKEAGIDEETARELSLGIKEQIRKSKNL